MSRYRFVGEKLVQLFAEGMDLEKALAELRLTPERAVRALRRGEARAARRARLLLARRQTELVAARFSPSAVAHLVRVMNGENASAALSAALRVMDAGVGKREGRKGGVREKGEGGGAAEQREQLRPEDVGPMIALLEEIGRRGSSQETGDSSQ